MDWLGTAGSPVTHSGRLKWLGAGALLVLTAVGGCLGPGLEPPLETADSNGPGVPVAGVGATGTPANGMDGDALPDDRLTDPKQNAGSLDAGAIDMDAGAGTLDAGVSDTDSGTDDPLDAGSDGG